jgi:hypothetical protein
MGVVTLFQGKTSTVAAPSLATDGVPLWKGAANFLNPNEGFNEDLDEADLILYHTVYTSGVPAVAYARWWGGVRIDPATLIWVPGGQGTGHAGATTDKGRLNAGASIDGPTATSLYHMERIRGLRSLERIALETGGFTGAFTLAARLQGKVVR